MKKSEVFEILNSLEDEFKVEDLIRRLLFIEDIKKGLSDADNKRVYDYQSIKNRFLNK
jgi:hypothetical protein